jgi:hypothetical protein
MTGQNDTTDCFSVDLRSTACHGAVQDFPNSAVSVRYSGWVWPQGSSFAIKRRKLEEIVTLLCAEEREV